MGLKYVLRISEEEMGLLNEILNSQPIEPASHHPVDRTDQPEPSTGVVMVQEAGIIE